MAKIIVNTDWASIENKPKNLDELLFHLKELRLACGKESFLTTTDGIDELKDCVNNTVLVIHKESEYDVAYIASKYGIGIFNEVALSSLLEKLGCGDNVTLNDLLNYQKSSNIVDFVSSLGLDDDDSKTLVTVMTKLGLDDSDTLAMIS